MTKYSHAGANQLAPAQSASRTCPNCDSSYLDRVPRRVVDRIVALAVPVRRYQCESCGWQGNLIVRRA